MPEAHATFCDTALTPRKFSVERERCVRGAVWAMALAAKRRNGRMFCAENRAGLRMTRISPLSSQEDFNPPDDSTSVRNGLVRKCTRRFPEFYLLLLIARE